MLKDNLNKDLYEKYIDLKSMQETPGKKLMNDIHIFLGGFIKKIKPVGTFGGNILFFAFMLLFGYFIQKGNDIPHSTTGYIVMNGKVITDMASLAVESLATKFFFYATIFSFIVGGITYAIPGFSTFVYNLINTEWLKGYKSVLNNRKKYNENVKNNLQNIYFNDFIQNSGLFTENEISEYAKDLINISEKGLGYDGNEKIFGLIDVTDPRIKAYRYGLEKDAFKYKELLLSISFDKLNYTEEDLDKAYGYSMYYQDKPEKVINLLNYHTSSQYMEEAFDITNKSVKLKNTIDRELNAINKMKKDYYNENGIGVLGEKVKIRV